jgi:hypothetical protein
VEDQLQPQWIMREYLARRGSNPFRPEALIPARCPLLGYAMRSVSGRGRRDPDLVPPHRHPAAGRRGGLRRGGRQQLREFFGEQLNQFLRDDDLHAAGRIIIEACIGGATAADYERLSAEVEL